MTTKLMKLAALLLCLTVALWAADPCLGTWKLNVAKSKFDPGPPPRSWVATTETVGDQQKRTGERVMATGEKISTTWIGKPDGKEYPLQGGPPPSITLAVRGLSPTVQEQVYKTDGKFTITGRGVLSKDGKSATWRVKGTNTEGKPVTGTYVFEKQ